MHKGSTNYYFLTGLQSLHSLSMVQFFTFYYCLLFCCKINQLLVNAENGKNITST